MQRSPVKTSLPSGVLILGLLLALGTVLYVSSPTAQPGLVSQPITTDTWSARRFFYASDGLQVAAWRVAPTKAPGPLPLLLFLRGGVGDHGVIKPSLLPWLGKLATEIPALILAPQYRGSDGGEGIDEFGGRDLEDVRALLRRAPTLGASAQSRPLVLGFSRGGTMALMLMRSGDPPVAAVSVVGAPMDLAKTYHRRGEDLRGILRARLGGSPDERPAEYAARSALLWSEELTAPLLMLHGSADKRAAVEDVRALAAELEARGSPHRLRIFEAGDHMLKTHATDRDREVVRWFRKHAGVRF